MSGIGCQHLTTRGGSECVPPARWPALLLAAVCAALFVPAPAGARAATPTAANELSAPVSGVRTFPLPRPATHIAAHWRAHPHARVIVAFSRDGRHFGSWRPVRRDELGSARRDGETYGDLMVAPGVRAVRVRTDRPLAHLSVLALTDRSESARKHAWAAATQTSKTRTGSTTTAVASASASTASAAAVPQPAVIPRSGWGANESLRFDATGKEIWPPQFWPVQKLIVHHTATQNSDPDPAATIRSIYYYHAVTQGWGDIGYNFLIDEAGNIYEGRYSRAYAPGASPTGQDLNGNGVTAAHAQGFNSGTVGIALLGTLTNQDATPAARDALERLLAWEADGHGIDPQGSALYTNPVSGAQATFPNIAGHRDVAATECPGGAFYGTLPTIRSDVAARIAAAHGTPPPPPPPPTPTPTPPDTTAPQTTIDTAKISQPKRMAKLTFSSSEPGSMFECKLDKKSLKSCTSPTTYKKLKPGKHKFQVAARDVAGNLDPTPAVKKFKIKK